MNLILLAIVVLACCQSGKPGDKYPEPTHTDETRQHLCTRNFEINCLGKVCLARGEGCVDGEGTGDKNMYQNMNMLFNAEEVPVVVVGGGECDQKKVISGEKFRLGFHKMVQYKPADSQTTDEYEDGVSTALVTYNLNEFTWAQWTRTDLGDGVHEMYTIGVMSNSTETIQLWMTFSKAERVDEPNPSENKPIIDPKTVKVSMEINGLTFHDEATGIAIKNIMGMRLKLQRQTRTQTQTQSQYRQFEENDDNQVHICKDEEGKEIGFFAYQTKAMVQSQIKNVVMGKVEDIDGEQLQTRLRERLQLRTETKLQAIWVSIVGTEQPIYYDPSVGVLTSDVKTLVFSLMMVLAIFAALL